MKEADIALIDLPQSGGGSKLRPALILKRLPKYNDFLVCGISTQISQHVKDFDEVLNEEDTYFKQTGLHKTSLIRTLFLAVVSPQNIPGSIGRIPGVLHKDILERLSKFLSS
ncbi:MAG: type II toxin-antitoxin system PemK/MazF family toxin [Ginsengibacter sp.]